MRKKDMEKLHKGVSIHGSMKQDISLPMQGVFFKAGESVTVIPYRPGADIVIVTSIQDSRKRAEMSLYQIQQFIS